MQLAVWLLICGALALGTRARPAVCIIGVLVLWLLIPAVGGSTLTGQATGLLSVHPATWLVLATFVTQSQRGPQTLFQTVARHPYIFIVITVVISGAFVTTVSRAGGGGMVLLVDQIVAPTFFFVLVLVAAQQERRLVDWLRTALLLLAAIISMVAFAQWISGDVLFYAESFSKQYWFDPEDGRWMGPLDTPLTLSMVLCVIAPLTAGMPILLQTTLLALMSGAVVVSQSRTGLVVYLLVLLYLVVASRVNVLIKASMIAGLGGIGSLLLATPLAEGVLGRIADDTGSSAARGDALSYFFDNWIDYLFVGGGVGSSYDVAEQAGLVTSLESSILMYAVDLGIVIALLYFGLLLFLVLINRRVVGVRGLALAALLAILIPQTFSALATRSAAGIMMWTVVAMVAAAGDASRRAATSRSTLYREATAS